MLINDMGRHLRWDGFGAAARIERLITHRRACKKAAGNTVSHGLSIRAVLSGPLAGPERTARVYPRVFGMLLSCYGHGKAGGGYRLFVYSAFHSLARKIAHPFSSHLFKICMLLYPIPGGLSRVCYHSIYSASLIQSAGFVLKSLIWNPSVVSR